MLPLLFPFIAARITWWIAGFIGLGGIGLSLFYSNWYIFSRSGSLLVVFALLLALVDYTSSTKLFFDQVREALGPKYRLDELERIRQLVRDEIKEYGFTKSDEEIAYLADQKLESYWEGFPARLGGALKMRSVTSEVSIAIIGTLIWGFGDLLG